MLKIADCFERRRKLEVAFYHVSLGSRAQEGTAFPTLCLVGHSVHEVGGGQGKEAGTASAWALAQCWVEGTAEGSWALLAGSQALALAS